MTDKLQELERLNGLRERGSLSAEEFERAKANVLGGDKPEKGFVLPWVAGAGMVGIALAMFFVKPMLATSTGGAVSADTPQKGDGWTVSQRKDPMTDVVSTTAIKSFAGAAADIEVTIVCANTGQVSYQLASFGKDHKPMEMRSQLGGYDTNPWITVPFEMRIDGEPAIPESTNNPTYNNVVSLLTPAPSVAEISDADKAARARLVTFAVHLAHSDETVVVDQASPAIASLLRPCVEQRAQQLTQAKAEAQRQEAAEERQRQAQRPSPAEAM